MKSSLFVAGLDYSMTTEELIELFNQHGTVVSAKIVTDQYSGTSKGFGFVEMSSGSEAAECIAKLNGTNQKGGRQISVREKEDKPSSKSSYGSRNNNRRGW